MAIQEEQNKPIEPEDLMNVTQMAQFFKIPQNTAYKMLLSRVIPSYKMGKLRRVMMADCLAYRDANRVEAIRIR
jgi:excisionase family DNA binding protein